MRILIIFIIFISEAYHLIGQKELGPISDSLRFNADAVVLNNNETLEIHANNKIIRTTTTEILVWSNNKNAVNLITIAYDQFTKVEDINISIFDMEGKKIKTIKKKDFIDQVADDGFSVATDNRFLFYNIVENKTPYIIKKEIKTLSTQSLNISGYSPYEGERVSVLKSTFTIINFDVTNPLRLNETILGTPVTDSTSIRHRYEWAFYNMTASRLKSEKESHKNYAIMPVLENFQMDGVTGSLKNWLTFGNWLTKLNEGMDVLSEKTNQEIKAVIGTETDKKVIINKLYTYLQENMRYVSIQLGIGGYRPMPAQTVHDFKYGDCKGLSIYMKSLLNVAGIPSLYVIINAGKNALSPDPGDARNVFNHAIIAVPFENDTLFLECTASDVPAGYQGSFTGNRTALIVNGENSGLVNTTEYNHLDNKIINVYDISLNKAGPAPILHKQILKGIGTEHHGMNFSKNMTDEKFKNHLLDNAYKDISGLSVEMRNDLDKESIPAFEMNTKYTSERKVHKMGDRFFVETDMDNLPVELIYDLDKTKGKYRIMHGFSVIDSFNIRIPVGCHVEKMPKDQQQKFLSGEIEYKTLNRDSTILQVVRNLVFLKGEYLLGDKGSMSELLTALKKIRAEKIVINCKS